MVLTSSVCICDGFKVRTTACVWGRDKDGEKELVDTVRCSLESVGDAV